MRKRANRSRGQSRSWSRKSAAKQQSLAGYRALLAVCSLLTVGWLLTRVPPGLLIAGSIVILIVILLGIILWFIVRSRPTPEELLWSEEQQMQAVRMEETAQAIGVRPVELADLAHLSHEEFEYFTGALLEAMGVLSEWERVGGSGDHGIDLRGKNRHGLLIVVQCKHFFSGKVTPRQTREFGWALGQHNADEAWFVTTASFTEQARADVEKLTYSGHMTLIDGEKLLEYLWEHWHALPNKWQWRLTECTLKNSQVRE